MPEMQRVTQEHYVARLTLEAPAGQKDPYVFQREFVEHPTHGDIKDILDEEMAKSDPGCCTATNLAKVREMMDFAEHADNNGFLSICGTKIGRIYITKKTIWMIDNRRVTCTSKTT